MVVGLKTTQPRVFWPSRIALQKDRAANKMGVKVITVYALFNGKLDTPRSRSRFLSWTADQSLLDNYVPGTQITLRFRWLGRQIVCLSRLLALKSRGIHPRTIRAWFSILCLTMVQSEITQASAGLAQDVLDAKINPGDITEDMTKIYLFTQHLPKDLRDPIWLSVRVVSCV